jgi:hypothetical protein
MRGCQGVHTCRFSSRRPLSDSGIAGIHSTSSCTPRVSQHTRSSLNSSYVSPLQSSCNRGLILTPRVVQGPWHSSCDQLQASRISQQKRHVVQPRNVAAGGGVVPGDPSPSGPPAPLLLPRGGQAGPGPGSARDAGDAPGGGPDGPRRPPLGRRLAQALLRPLAALAQAVSGLFRRFIPNAKRRRWVTKHMHGWLTCIF